MGKIVCEQYGPAQWRTDALFDEAKGPNKLKQEVQFGDLREDEISMMIIPELERWALREERWTDHNSQEVTLLGCRLATSLFVGPSR